MDAMPCESNLTKLFPSPLVLDQAPPHALGVRYLCGPTVTVLASKTSKQRYRLQSDNMAALGVTLNWLLSRLRHYYEENTSTFTAKLSSPLPLPEYFEIIERHLKVITYLNNL